MNVWHVSRMFAGRDRERFPECICDEAPCGLVVPGPDCAQHGLKATRTMRRGHPAAECPGATS